MRFASAGLLDDVVTSYDQTKTTLFGRAFSKTVDGKTALGPPLNKFADVFTDSANTPAANGTFLTSNGRMFVLAAEAGAITPLMLYNVNYATGATTYVGRVNIILPDVAATTTVYRSIKVIDTGTSGWKVFIATTGSVLINGGLMLVNNLALSDFVAVGFPSIPFATGNDQKAVYFCQETGQMGALHLMTAAAGAVFQASANKIFVHNGVAATHQYYVFNTNTAPTYSTAAITGTEATNTINHAGHTFVNGDQVTFTALTGGAGFVVGTVYFVVNSVAGVSYQLSATSGGAAINFTTDISAGNIGRAFGQTDALFSHKTGNLPALTGVLLLTDSEDLANPGHTINAGQDCAFFATTGLMYMGQLSELTAGATSWPSLISANFLGTANQIVVPSITYVSWSPQLDRAVLCSLGFIFIIKQFINSAIDAILGGTGNRYLEGFPLLESIELQPASAITAMDMEQGWLAITNGSTGQRGIMLADLRSDALFDYSYIITKVMSTPEAVYRFITTVDALYDFTGSLDVYYRTSGFGSASGGWVHAPFAEDLSSLATGDQVQFKIYFSTLGLDTSIPAQLCDFHLGFESLTDNSDHWELSVDDSDNGNPSRTAFRLKAAYPTSVPALRYLAYDLDNVLIVDNTTTANASRFEYSSNSGVSWNSLGTIPNTVGTLVRYTFATPPGVDIRPGLREL